MLEPLVLGETHVWYLYPDKITDPVRLREYQQILTDDERARNSCYRFQRDRHAHLLTRTLVRTMLSRYTHVAPAEWRFSQNSYGKPAVSSPTGVPGIAFNVSHTIGLIMCAFALETDVGIDVEHVRYLPDGLDIARSHFSQEEYESLEALTEIDQHTRFFEYWTLKESYVKARGLGISINLRGFTFGISPTNVKIAFEASDDQDPGAWQFQLWRPTDKHVAAATVRCALQQSVFKVRDATPLME